MRGRDVTEPNGPGRRRVPPIAVSPDVRTIGIGDGGNEIGMGKIPHETIVKNIPNGDLIHCRVPTDHLIVAGVSNWGAYALAAGVYVLRGVKPPADLFDPDREREILEVMVREGPLVDGVTGKQTATVDGLIVGGVREAARPHPRDSGVVTVPTSATPPGPTSALACRDGRHTGPTPGLALGFVQANLVVLPKDWAFDFLLFCQRNPKPCPLLDVTEPGDPEPKAVAPGADLRTDLPAYRVWRERRAGRGADRRARSTGATTSSAFVIGCSFTFENALLEAGVPVRHIEQGVNVPMYRTNIPCRPAGRFRGPMVVSMRPLTPAQAIEATPHLRQVPARPRGTGPLRRPGGDRHPRRRRSRTSATRSRSAPGEVPVFWACGVTPQAVLMQARPPFAITHKPGHMFLTDLRDRDLEAV